MYTWSSCATWGGQIRWCVGSPCRGTLLCLSVLDAESAVPTLLCIPLPGGHHSSTLRSFFWYVSLESEQGAYASVNTYTYVHMYVYWLVLLAETEAGSLLSSPTIPAQLHFHWFSQYEINLGLNCRLFLTKVFKRTKESHEDLLTVSMEPCPTGPLCCPDAWQRLFCRPALVSFPPFWPFPSGFLPCFAEHGLELLVKEVCTDINSEVVCTKDRFGYLSKCPLDVHPRAYPSFRVFRACSGAFWLLLKLRGHLPFWLFLSYVSAFFCPLECVLESWRVFSVPSVLKSHPVSWWGPCCCVVYQPIQTSDVCTSGLSHFWYYYWDSFLPITVMSLFCLFFFFLIRLIAYWNGLIPF